MGPATARRGGCIVHGAPRGASRSCPVIPRADGNGNKAPTHHAGARMSTVDPDSPPPGGDGGPPTDELPVADPRGGPTVLRMLLGTQLRRLREEAGVTPDQAGYEIRASRSKI